jgi:Lrp/AsnC family transcriptional regulator, leucine-responsive regulatory protein
MSYGDKVQDGAKMDQFDIKILNIVQRNNYLSIEKIADEVGLSPSAVRRRLRRLNEEAVIESNVSTISPEAVGRKLIAIVGVTLESERPYIIEDFKKSMLAAPEVMQCYYVTGDADFILIVTATDMQGYEAFTRRFFSENPNVKRFETNVVIKRVKSGLMLPLDIEHL